MVSSWFMDGILRLASQQLPQISLWVMKIIFFTRVKVHVQGIYAGMLKREKTRKGILSTCTNNRYSLNKKRVNMFTL